MFKRKGFKLFTALMMIGILLLSACTKGTTTTSTTAPSASAPASSAPSAAATTTAKKPFTFTMNMDNPNINWTSEVAQEITKRTGATIKWDIITGDFRTKMNVWLAAGDYPEVINIHDNTLQSYITAKAVLDLTPLIKEHAPNIMKAYNNDLSPLQSADGKVYGLLQPPTKKVVNLNKFGWIAVQSAVLKDAGYPQIKTLDELQNIVSNYMKKYPDIGGGKTIGFSNFGAANMFYNVFDTAAKSYAGFAPTAQYFIDDQNNARLRFFEPGYTDAFKWLNKINAAGLFDPESLVQTQEQFTTKCNQGRVLAIFATNGSGADCSDTLSKNGMDDRSYVKIDIIAPGKTKYDIKPDLTAVRGGDMWLSITKNAKDPVRIIEFYDDMFKLENQILVGWGIENKYYKVENGKRVVTDWFLEQVKAHPDTYYEDLGIGYARPLSTNYSSGFTLSDGDFASFGMSESWISKNMKPTQVETLAKYGAKTNADLIIKPTERDYQFTPSIAKWTDDVKKFNTEAIAEFGKVVPKMILEKDPSKLDGIWAGFQKTLQDKGLDKQNKDVTTIYQDYLKSVKK